MRILLDTNILIPLEDSSKALEPHLAQLYQIATQHGHQFYVHPASITDIARDKNLARAEITRSRLDRYPFIEAPPRLSPQTPLAELNNEEVDDEILYSLKRNVASVLVTEDRGIHKKSSARGLSAQVLYVQQAVAWLERLHSEKKLTFPNIQDVPIHSLDIRSSFFDSLREGYEGFDKWFFKSAQEGRKAWIYQGETDSLLAICIYKKEHEPVVTDDGRGLKGNVLKLCTFKVGEDVRGRRVGELFLKAALKYSFDNDIHYIYLTMLDSQGHLKDLCSKYGFSVFGRCGNGREIAMVKENPAVAPKAVLDPLEYHIRYSPCIKLAHATQILVIPIQPPYHNLLFPEVGSQLQLFINSTIGNGLTLAYLCHARLKNIQPGDVIVFYRSQDLKELTTLGVVENSFITNDQDEIVRNVAKRTVFSMKEIGVMASENAVRVILFRLALHFPARISHQALESKGVIRGNIQTIRKIDHNAFKKIADIAGFASRVLAD